MTASRLALGAPGVYRDARPRPAPLRAERLDVAGFVGIAPRGPVDEPVALDSWSDFRRRFGGVEGPGLLAYAVHAFFAQGGARAVVLRVSPLPRWPAPAAVAAHARHIVRLRRGDAAAATAPTIEVGLLARDEGGWGDRLSIQWTFEARQRFRTVVRDRVLDLPAGARLPESSLVRLRGTTLPAAGVFGWTGAVVDRVARPGSRIPATMLDVVSGAGAALRTAGTVDVDVAVVTATVIVTDDDPRLRRGETFADLGLRRGHPRHVLDVLEASSVLVRPDAGAPDALLPPDAFLGSVDSTLGRAGADRTLAIDESSFVDVDLDPSALPVAGIDGLPDGLNAYGVERMSLNQEIGLLAVPDLLWDGIRDLPAPDVPREPASARFGPCPAPSPIIKYAPRTVERLLDAAAEPAVVMRRQHRVVDLAQRQGRFVALLDVPPRLPARSVARWRAQIDSSYAAAYHPWLRVVVPEDPARRTVAVPPSGVAAGIIAERELRLGLPWGPAAELAVDPVLGADAVTDADHDALFALSVNVFRTERDGLRLSSARTLSVDPTYRQLSVRRLMTMLRLAIDRHLQWLVFEPNTAHLRLALTTTITRMLRELFRAGAFAGDTEEESFFVRCDGTINPPSSTALGRLVAEVGVAPAEPLEFLVVRITQDAEGALGVEAEP